MAKIVIILNKEDIVTKKLGVNYLIETNDIQVVFTQEAFDEFVRDVKKINERENNKQ